MASETLTFTKIGPLPPYTIALQQDDGTIFYNKTTKPQRLYVKVSGKEVHAKLDDDIVSDVRAYGNAIYFRAKRKIFKSFFILPNSVSVYFLRDMSEDEKILDGILCTGVKDGSNYVYRMFEKSSMKDEVPYDVADMDMDGMELKGLHRGKILFIQQRKTNRPVVRKLNEDSNVIVIELPEAPWFTRLITRESSSLAYVTDGKHLYTVDIELMKFLPTIRLDNGIVEIVGVHDGKITVTAKNCNEYSLMTALLPKGYYDFKTTSYEELKDNARRMKLRIEELEKVKNQRTMETEEFIAIKDEVEKSKTRCERLERELEEMKKNNNEQAERLTESSEKAAQWERKCMQLLVENNNLKQKIKDMRRLLDQSKVGALQSAMSTLKFREFEKLEKLYICTQLEDGNIAFIDNEKPFDMFIMHEGSQVNAQLNMLEGQYDFTLRGTVGNNVYFSTRSVKSRGMIKFYQASVVKGKITINYISEMKTSAITLFKNTPRYYLERSGEWSVYEYYEDYSNGNMMGEKFNVAGIDYLSKYECHYHRNVLYLFREDPQATVEKVNDKVVRVEGPLLDTVTSFYTPPGSECVYINNSELLVLNTITLAFSQISYERQWFLDRWNSWSHSQNGLRWSLGSSYVVHASTVHLQHDDYNTC